jgi:glutamate racemase
MKIIIIDSGLGGKDFIKKLKKNIKLETHFVKPFDNMVSS